MTPQKGYDLLLPVPQFESYNLWLLLYEIYIFLNDGQIQDKLISHNIDQLVKFSPLVISVSWCLSQQNLELDVTSNKTLANSLDNATRDNNPFFNSMLRIMTTRCMMQALYFCSGTLEPPEYHHYGLATPTYTHFTSPIRRLVQLLLRKLLASSLFDRVNAVCRSLFWIP